MGRTLGQLVWDMKRRKNKNPEEQLAIVDLALELADNGDNGDTPIFYLKRAIKLHKDIDKPMSTARTIKHLPILEMNRVVHDPVNSTDELKRRMQKVREELVELIDNPLNE